MCGGLWTRLLRWKRRHWLIEPPSADFLRSAAYQDEMVHSLSGEAGLNEAEDETVNYNHRHHKVNRQLGVWRWRGMQNNLDALLPLIESGNLVVDFGGAACPLGLGSLVVDQLKRDGAGNSVRYHSISELTDKADVVFTSHCLEHIEQIDEVLSDIHNSMVAGGDLLVFVPAWTCERWRSGIHKNEIYNDHVWTFALQGEKIPEMERVKYIDAVIDSLFDVQHAEYCGDNSIFIHAKMKATVEAS